MPAAITNNFKKQIIQDLINDINDSDQSYFLAIGRSEPWNDTDTPPTPTGSLRDIRNLQLSLQSIKNVEALSFATRRVNWFSGTVYSAYDDAVAGLPNQNYFVLTNANRIYICLKQGKNDQGVAVASTVEPTSTGTQAFTLSDGYTWKFLFTITATNVNNLMSANYMPVRFLTSADSDIAFEVQQKAIQDAAIPGQITDIRLLTTGAGYTSVPTVSIIGNGTGASAVATIDSDAGQVTKIEMVNDSDAFGSGYDYAEVVVSGGGATANATARAVLSTPLGIGGDPRDDLRATAIVINAKPAGAEGGDFLVGQDFRQVALLKNPKLPDSDGAFVGITGLGLKRMKLSSVTTPFSADNVIVGGTSGARAFIDQADSDTIFFHQTESTGFTRFNSGEALSESDGVGIGVIDNIDSADSAGEFGLFSGDILYIDNRAAVERDPAQTEDFKVVFQL